jgi:hypothetical protein
MEVRPKSKVGTLQGSGKFWTQLSTLKVPGAKVMMSGNAQDIAAIMTTPRAVFQKSNDRNVSGSVVEDQSASSPPRLKLRL